MKTYVLTVSQKFPASHPRAGELTNFPDAILQGGKIHTIRANFELWEKRINEVIKGAARLSVRVWTDKPYNSPQREIISLDSTHGVGIQKLEFWPVSNFWAAYTYSEKDEQEFYSEVTSEKLAKNDGLTLNDFTAWFKDYDLTEPMAVIHFTPFRYNK